MSALVWTHHISQALRVNTQYVRTSGFLGYILHCHSSRWGHDSTAWYVDLKLSGIVTELFVAKSVWCCVLRLVELAGRVFADVRRAFLGWMTSKSLCFLTDLSKHRTRLSVTRRYLVCVHDSAKVSCDGVVLITNEYVPFTHVIWLVVKSHDWKTREQNICTSVLKTN